VPPGTYTNRIGDDVSASATGAQRRCPETVLHQLDAGHSASLEQASPSRAPTPGGERRPASSVLNTSTAPSAPTTTRYQRDSPPGGAVVSKNNGVVAPGSASKSSAVSPPLIRVDPALPRSCFDLRFAPVLRPLLDPHVCSP
jgi:hypothetical protein